MSCGPRISWQGAREGRGREDQGGCLEVEPIGQGGPGSAQRLSGPVPPLT